MHLIFRGIRKEQHLLSSWSRNWGLLFNVTNLMEVLYFVFRSRLGMFRNFLYVLISTQRFCSYNMCNEKVVSYTCTKAKARAQNQSTCMAVHCAPRYYQLTLGRCNTVQVSQAVH